MHHLSGHLELTCAVDDRGRSYLSRQSFRAPFHLSKPYWDGHALVVQIANPTAGIFSGDTLQSEINVEAGARLLLTTPSASRAHTMPEGRAQIRQTFRIAAGGWLEVMPELFIPQAGCQYFQKTRIEVAANAGLFFVETIAPGRVARGEVFQFAIVDWETEILIENRLVVRERFALRPGDYSMASMVQLFPACYYTTCFLVSELATEEHPCWKAISQLNSQHVWCAASRLVPGGWTIKILAADSISLREACRHIRSALDWIPPLQCNPRKL